MKNLSLYIFLILMICNVGFAECIEGDCSNGYGTYTTNNGDKYVGEFKDGKRHGKGTLTFPHGGVYVGEFQNDKEHGRATYTRSSGEIWKGIWENGTLVKCNEGC